MNASAPALHSRDGPVLALSGGIGGAKLALGLSRILPPGRLELPSGLGQVPRILPKTKEPFSIL